MASLYRSLWSELQKYACGQKWLLTPVPHSKAYFQLFKTPAPIMHDDGFSLFPQFLTFPLGPSVEVPQPGRHTSDFNSWPLNAEVSAAAAAISHSRWKGNEHWGCWGWHGALTTPAIATLTASLHRAGIWEELRGRCSDWGQSPV